MSLGCLHPFFIFPPCGNSIAITSSNPNPTKRLLFQCASRQPRLRLSLVDFTHRRHSRPPHWILGRHIRLGCRRPLPRSLGPLSVSACSRDNLDSLQSPLDVLPNLQRHHTPNKLVQQSPRAAARWECLYRTLRYDGADVDC